MAKQEMIIATNCNIDDIVELRVEMQIEDWNNTLSKDFSCHSIEFAKITKNHLIENLINQYFLQLCILMISQSLCVR